MLKNYFRRSRGQKQIPADRLPDSTAPDSLVDTPVPEAKLPQAAVRVRERRIWLRLTLAVVTLSLMIVSAGIVWVMQKPRSVPWIKTEVERILNQHPDAVSAQIQEAVIRWGGLRKGLGIHLLNTTITDASQLAYVRIADMEIRPELDDLLLGRLTIEHLALYGVSVEVSPGKAFSSFAPVGEARAFDIAQFDTLDPKIVQLYQMLVAVPFERLSMKQVTVSVIRENRLPLEFMMDSAELRIRKNELVSTLMMDASFDSYLKGLHFRGELRAFAEGQSSLMFQTKEFPLSFLKKILGNRAWMSADHRLDSEITFFWNQQGKMEKVAWYADSSENQFTRIYADIVYAKIAEKPKLVGEIEVTNAPVSTIAGFWPKGVAEPARLWVAEHLKSGQVDRFRIRSETESFDALLHSHLKQGYLTMEASVSRASMSYHPAFPELENLNAELSLMGDVLTIQLKKGALLSSTLSDSTVTLYDLEEEKPMISVNGHLEGSLKDAFTLLSALGPPQAFYPKLSGKASTQASFTFPLLQDVEMSQVQHNISATLSQVRLREWMPAVAFEDGTFQVAIENGKTTINGQAKYMDSTLHIEGAFGEEDAQKQRLYIQGMLGNEGVTALSKLFDISLSGQAEIALDVSLGSEGIERVEGDFDATDVQIENPYMLRWEKIPGIIANGNFVATWANETELNIQGFEFRSEGVRMVGGARINPENKSYEIQLDNITLDRNFFGVTVAKSKGKALTIQVKGDALDIQNVLVKEAIFSQEEVPMDRYNITLDLGTVYLYGEQKLQNFVGEVKCKKQACETVTLTARDDKDRPFIVSLQPDKTGEQKLEVKIADMGSTLRGLDFVENVRGGSLEINGKRRAGKEGGIEGRVFLDDFTVRDAPVLARILNLASITGMASALSGDGISFKKAKGNFVYNDHDVTLSDFKANGNSIGITVDGNVSLVKETLDVKGVVIPAYAINTLLGDIPIGNIIVGDKGLFAANYSVKGALTKPDVSVNPLSILTPGFLRGIWGD